MTVNSRGGTVPRHPKNYDTPLEAAARGALAAYARAMDANRLQEGAAQLVALASAANRYVEETAPYKLAKQPERAAELDSVLANLARTVARIAVRSEEHTSELQSRLHLVCRLLLEKKKKIDPNDIPPT